jgi:hypothetical protein
VKTHDYVGNSKSSLCEAIKDALHKAGEHQRYEIIESLSTRSSENTYHYQVLLAIFS